MPGCASISRQCLAGAPGALASLNSGLQSWGHPGMIATAGDVEGALAARITEEDGPNGLEKWFEVGFQTPNLLSGDATRGWVDLSGRITLAMLWSDDLTSWRTQQFIDVTGSPTAVSGGYEYWVRSILPQDSEISTGGISAGASGYEDVRNQPFTSLVINSVVQALPNFPYQMPGDAAQMQTDLRALGWTGATVVSSAWDVWTIEIPDVDFTTYASVNAVFWPIYYIANMFGDVVNPVSNRGFHGDFVNAVGTPTKLQKQFARLRILAL
jgi:hypothetical protein